MTLTELSVELVKRIGWRADGTVERFSLSASNILSESGLDFQQEHSAVTLANIRDCQPITNISETDYQNYLEVIKLQAVNQVLNDSFERDVVNDDLLTLFPRGFDKAIMLRMVIIVAELISTSGRKNGTKRFSDEFLGRLNYDVFRSAPNKFAIRGANYNYTLGIATRYGFEIESVQRRFGTQRNLLKTITKGQVSNYEQCD
jgi:hypothetical protein